MNHGLETHVDLAAANDLGDIRRVIRLQQGHLEAFILEVAAGLGEIEGRMVRGGVPLKPLASFKIDQKTKQYQCYVRAMSAYQLVRKVILSVAMMMNAQQAQLP